MITLKELSNVSKYPRTVPFPGEEYAKETFIRMKEQLRLYETYFKGKEYSIIFSDGEEIDFKILEKNICHMLGIEYNNFFMEGDYYNYFLSNVLNIKNKPQSYEWVKIILDAYEDVINYDKSGNGPRAINYFKSKIKCSIFEKLFELEDFNFGKLQSSNGTKLLYTQSIEPISPYFCIRLKQEDCGESTEHSPYIINSLLAPLINELEIYFKEEASIPTQIMVDNNNTVSRKEATPQQKIYLLNQYKSIILGCNGTDNLNIYGDYIASLSQAAGIVKTK